MFRKKFAALASIVLMGFGLAVMTASPAYAATEYDDAVPDSVSNGHYKYCANTQGDQACVQPYGDVLWIKDRHKDGHRVQLFWEDTDGDRSGVCINTQGYDAGWTRCNKNFPEDHQLRWWTTWYDSTGRLQISSSHYTTI